MRVENLHNKKVLVVGLGVTGGSVVRFLHKHAIAFDVVDERSKPAAELKECLQGVEVHELLNSDLCSAYDVLVLSPGVPRATPAVQSAIENGALVIGDIELFAHAIGDTPVIAVTGSNGKSTVVSWVAHVLQACGKRAELCGNIGLPALDSISDAVEIYVLELSSYQLESTTSLKTLSATVLNVSDDHLDRYESIEHYAEVKRGIYNNGRHCVVNRDDHRTWSAPEAVNADSVVSQAGIQKVSTQQETEQQAAEKQGAVNQGAVNQGVAFSLLASNVADYHLSGEASDAWLACGEKNIVQRDRLPNPGNHNVANALAVLALLEPLQLDTVQVVESMLSFSGLEHRTEFVLEHDGVRWYNDSKGTNVDACKKAIEAMGAPVVLIAGGIGKGADFVALRDVVQQHVKAVVLIGEAANQMQEALEGTTSIAVCDTLDEAVSQCAAAAKEGDVVLLSPACSSFDMFDSFEHRGVMFKVAVEAIAA